MALAQRRVRALRQLGLPSWPVTLPFAAYVAWWLLGIGDFVWVFAGILMAVLAMGIYGLRIPRPLVLWLFFCGWVGVSLVMNDTPGRVVGASYRLLLYLAAGMFGIYVFNAGKSLTLKRVSVAMTWFLAGMSVCGYWALVMPQLVIKTPMSYVVPAVLQRNPLVSDMVVRRLTQWKADAWVEQAVRPVAPFLYANTWGNVYSMVLPFAVINLWLHRGTRHAKWLFLVIAASAPAALSTLNRGMLIGLGVVGLWVIVQSLRRGFVGPVIKAAVGGSFAFVVWYFSPMGEKFFTRIEETNSTEDRQDLYQATLDQAFSSPFLGFGSPRPAEYPWLPSLGTQGQLWTVMYSHGFVGLALFMGFLVWVFLRAAPRTDPVNSLLGGIMLATIVETFYYGMMTGIMVTMVAAGLILRPKAEILSSVDRQGTGDQTSSTFRPPSRRKRASRSVVLRRGRFR